MKPLNFKENIVIGATSSNEKIIVIDNKNGIDVNILIKKSMFIFKESKNKEKFVLSLIINGIAATKIAKAGVGNPENSVFWFSSILNFANRKAEKTTIINEISDIILWEKLISIKEFSLPNEAKISWNIIKLGASPKLTTSERESNSLPNSEVAFSKRAVKPSKKSKILAIKISIDEYIKYSVPWNDTKIASEPQRILSDVIKFGIINL